MSSLKTYISLTKTGIIRGNLITAIAGFFLASQGNINFILLAAMLTGLSLVMASACVFNNFLDREIDKKMPRTRGRALAAGLIPAPQALLFGTSLGISGAFILGLFTNYLTLVIALIGFFLYVVVYAVYKRRSVNGTLVGSIPGAAPPVIGYTAVSANLDLGALILFLILVLWQMPHFYAIALYRSKDYSAAGIPVLPVVKGPAATKLSTMLYVIAFIFATISLTVFDYTGTVYLVIAFLLGLAWLLYGISKYKISDHAEWGHGMFRVSLIVLTLLCLTISVESFF